MAWSAKREAGKQQSLTGCVGSLGLSYGDQKLFRQCQGPASPFYILLLKNTGSWLCLSPGQDREACPSEAVGAETGWGFGTQDERVWR